LLAADSVPSPGSGAGDEGRPRAKKATCHWHGRMDSSQLDTPRPRWTILPAAATTACAVLDSASRIRRLPAWLHWTSEAEVRAVLCCLGRGGGVLCLRTRAAPAPACCSAMLHADAAGRAWPGLGFGFGLGPADPQHHLHYDARASPLSPAAGRSRAVHQAGLRSARGNANWQAQRSKLVAYG